MIRGETEGEELQGDRHSCVGYILMQEAFITPENTKWDNFLASLIASLSGILRIKEKKIQDIVRK